MIFIDTGAFLARYLRKDQHHRSAVEAWEEMGSKRENCVTSNFVLDETFTLPFYPEVEFCPHCGTKLHVQKRWEKTIVTMDIGAFKAKETALQCQYDKAVFTRKQS